MVFKECSGHTPKKHDMVRYLFRHWLRTQRMILAGQQSPSVVYIDLNAGPGFYRQDGRELACSSVQIFWECPEELGLEAYLVDKRKCVCDELKRNLSNVAVPSNQWARVYKQDNLEFATAFNRPVPQPVLIFADPMGAGKQEFKALQVLADRYPHADIFMQYQANSAVRAWVQRGGPENGFHTLRDNLDKIRRTHRYVTDMTDRQGYGFFFASDKWLAPVDGPVGFYDYDEIRDRNGPWLFYNSDWNDDARCASFERASAT